MDFCPLVFCIIAIVQNPSINPWESKDESQFLRIPSFRTNEVTNNDKVILMTKDVLLPLVSQMRFISKCKLLCSWSSEWLPTYWRNWHYSCTHNLSPIAQLNTFGEVLPAVVAISKRIWQLEETDMTCRSYAGHIQENMQVIWPKKITKTNKTVTKTFWEHLLRAILETCDLWDICSEWWEDMTWPKNWQRQIQIQRQLQRQRQRHFKNTS